MSFAILGRRQCVTIAVCVAFAQQIAFGDDARSPSLTPQIAGVIGWLPPDTETLYVAQSFQMLDLEAAQGERPRLNDFRYGCQLSAMEGLWSLDHGKYLKPLAGKKVVAALRGARRYDVVSNFGSLRSEGCSVVIFDRDLDDGGKEWTALLRDGARKIVHIDGYEVFVFESTTVMEGWVKQAPSQGTFLVLLTPKIILFFRLLRHGPRRVRRGHCRFRSCSSRRCEENPQGIRAG